MSTNNICLCGEIRKIPVVYMIGKKCVFFLAMEYFADYGFVIELVS